VGFLAKVVNGLSSPVDPPGPRKVAADVEQSQFHASNLGKPNVRFQVCQSFGKIPRE
jgi:hypothetical protein